jgi:Antitoxin MazE-like
MAEDTGERVQRHRASLRAAGLRPMQIWVPDTRRPGLYSRVLATAIARTPASAAISRAVKTPAGARRSII